MKKKIIPVIISLICLALLGIIGVQFFWIRNAIKVKEEQFNRSVNDALNIALKNLETREDILFIKRSRIGDSIQSLVQAFSNDPVLNLNYKLDSLLKQEDLLPDPHRRISSLKPDYFIEYNFRQQMPDNENYLYNLSEVVNYEIEINGYLDVKQLDSLMNKVYQEQKNESKKAKIAPVPSRIRDDMKRISSKARKIKEVIQKMAIELENKPLTLADRIDTANIQKILIQSLLEKGIDIPFEFAVESNQTDTSKIIIKSNGFTKDNLSKMHKVSLFPDDIFQKKDMLMVSFPQEQNLISESVSWMTLGSVFFTLIIIFTSVMSIVIIIRQKKVSDIKSDFINNMTHELKTPIATISIAVDSINNPKVIEDPEKIKNYTRVIKEENNRMNARVEQVLQMALLDSNEFRINPKPVDIHTILYKVADHLRLQVERKNGNLILKPDAQESVVTGDEQHLTSVFMNLLDNANKYSPETPEITITTKNQNYNLLVCVEDHGIGMNNETKSKVFEKFFRVSSGNIHNVKGFGLGLSYSKAIVLAHKGEIYVTSEPGKGSCFTVQLPV